MPAFFCDMDLASWGYIGLFVSTFISATVFAFPSLAVLVFVLEKGYNPYMCLLVALAGNSLGGLTCYGLGFIGKAKWLLKVGLTTEKLAKIERRIDNYGVWIALLSWIPFIGDPLIVAMGFFRLKFWPFFILMFIGKLLRYVALILMFFLFREWLSYFL